MNAMRLLILEDEEKETKRMQDAVDLNDEFEIVGITNSVEEALFITKEKSVEGVVVDLELNSGFGGSGLDYLKEVKTLDLEVRPLLIVTTNNESDVVYNACKSLNADMIYLKSKVDYSPAIVLNQFSTLRPFMKKTKPGTKSRLENDEALKKRIAEYVDEELNLIGISPNLKGRVYLFEAIVYLLENRDRTDLYYSQYLEDKHKVRKGTISTSIQDAVNNAWRNTPEEDLLKHFSANIAFKKGTPEPQQVIHFYVEKIKRRI